MIGGRVVNHLTHDPYACASQALIDFLAAYYNRDPQRARFLTSNNLSVPSAEFRALGGFDVSFAGAGGEDRELCLRWSHAGYRLLYAAEALVHHAHAMTLLSYARQHHAYGRGAAKLRSRALHHGYGPVALESLSFYLALLRYPMTARQLDQRTIASLLLLLSQFASAFDFVQAHVEELISELRARYCAT
jgi:GT2 family glycosyltransferase